MGRGALVAIAVGWAATAAAAEPPPPGAVRQLLAARCLACHGFDARARQAGLRLDTPDGLRARLESGAAAVVPGDPGSSAIVARVAATGPQRMPPPDAGPALTEAEQESLRAWIVAGAPVEPHWAFRPPAEVVPPEVPGALHPIDRFLRARQAERGLGPAAEAAPETLLRRASLDLTGLPPTPAEIDRFLAARAGDPEAAWAEAVDRLLASPHYGERQARGWLDMARYADSNGYSIDAPREIWPWRDWVVRAFNDDMPFDAFTVRQLAGDLLPGATADDRVATGFHRNTPTNEEGGIDKEQFRVDAVFDRVATTGTVWLGLTIGCAQCHDHKYDPVTQADYYRLFAFFNDQAETRLRVGVPGADPALLAAERDAAGAAVEAYVDARRAALDAWEAALNDDARGLLNAEQRAALGVAAAGRSPDQRRLLFQAGLGAGDQEFRRLNERFVDLRSRAESGPTTLVLEELPRPRRTTRFMQGDFTRPAEEVAPGTPAVLPGLAPGAGRPTRLDLARWIASPGNPLTARVVVNRLWQRLFGRGLVETDSDFGLAGSPPSHPELLDWLAGEFVRGGWSVKRLHRLLLASAAYRQESLETPHQAALDPANVLVARQRRLRLDAEAVRDVALVAAGRLEPRLGGPPVHPPVPAGTTAVGQVKRDWPTSTGPDRFRRGLYTFLYRASPPPALALFDAPDGSQSCTRRHRSNTPLQALVLLNDAAFVELAGALGSIVRAEGPQAAFRRCTGRLPDAEEAAILAALDADDCARVLLNLDETVTRE
ncbi:MAG: PSD1 and planctomycete cytochrome C domain-containing protein [Planctomycetaceae bacterium]